MKLRYFQIVELNELCLKIENKTISLKTGYKFSKLNGAILNELAFYNKKFQEIIFKYGQKDDKGEYVLNKDKTGIQIKVECLSDCQKELNELQNLEIDLEDILFDLEELEGLDLTTKDIGVLMPLIKE